MLFVLFNFSLFILLFSDLCKLQASQRIDPNFSKLIEDKFFEQFVDSHEYILTLFFVPGCESCNTILDEYENAAKMVYQEFPSSVGFAKVDGSKSIALCQAFDVKQFPAIKFLRHGEDAFEYTGERSGQDIYNFIKQELSPTVTLLSTVKEVLSFIRTAPKTVISFITSITNEKKFQLFNQTTSEIRGEFRFAILTDSSQFPLISGSEDIVQLYTNSGQQRQVYRLTNDETVYSLSTWLRISVIPEYSELGPETFPQYSNSELPLLIVFKWEKNKKFYEIIKTQVQNIRKKGVAVSYVDADMYGQYVTELGINPNSNQFPFAIVDYIKE
eukprot:c34011_g1_i1.p1 GENE.c34011_g1_i1~~c34011_g1_i1.p1  ORF type:complete len:329 (+),score=105.33 c34011_g1_i1:16-1002(+)